jgi:catechol 2,3-dioxygenase-like lactoylglutathione lyase family enzyme
MFRDTNAFSSFSTDDLQKAKQFYGETLGLHVVETPEGLELHISGSTPVFVYPSSNYTAPKHTVLNFLVEDIEEAVDELNRRGVRMEQYHMPDIKTDEKGIFWGDAGPRRDRLVQGPGRSRAVGAPGELAGNRRCSY